MDAINAIAKRRGLAVVEDACQAWLADYGGRKCGTLGDLGCFSFQNTKHLPAGEGGAVTGNSDELLDRCYAYHDCGRARGSFAGGAASAASGASPTASTIACSISRRPCSRSRSTSWSRDRGTPCECRLPGRAPEGNTRSCSGCLPKAAAPSGTCFPCATTPWQFHGLPRHKFIAALNAEGISSARRVHRAVFRRPLGRGDRLAGLPPTVASGAAEGIPREPRPAQGQPAGCATTVGMPQTVLLWPSGPRWTRLLQQSARSMPMPKCRRGRNRVGQLA